MLWKFLRFRPVLERLAFGGVIWLLFSSYCFGQAPAPAASPSPPSKVFIRFWNMLPQKEAVLDLVNQATPQQALVTAPSRNVFAQYVPVNAGPINLAVYRAGKRDAALKTFSAQPRPGTFLTLLVSSSDQAGNSVKFELLDDTIGDEQRATGSLRVRNFSTKAAKITLSPAKSVARGATLNSIGTTSLEFPTTGGPFEVAVFISLTDGSSVQQGAEIDFSKAKHSTMLITDDNYGRVNTRLVFDGYITPDT